MYTRARVSARRMTYIRLASVFLRDSAKLKEIRLRHNDSVKQEFAYNETVMRVENFRPMQWQEMAIPICIKFRNIVLRYRTGDTNCAVVYNFRLRVREDHFLIGHGEKNWPVLSTRTTV